MATSAFVLFSAVTLTPINSAFNANVRRISQIGLSSGRTVMITGSEATSL